MAIPRPAFVDSLFDRSPFVPVLVAPLLTGWDSPRSTWLADAPSDVQLAVPAPQLRPVELLPRCHLPLTWHGLTPF